MTRRRSGPSYVMAAVVAASARCGRRAISAPARPPEGR
jgi:hypothetical protein